MFCRYLLQGFTFCFLPDLFREVLRSCPYAPSSSWCPPSASLPSAWVFALRSSISSFTSKRSRAWAHVQRSGWPGRYSYWESYSFQGYRKNLNFTLNWVRTNTCLYEWMLGKGFLLYSVWNYKLVKEVVCGGDSCKSASSWLYKLFYITQDVLMAVFAPVTSQLVWSPSCLVSTCWVNSANHSHDD